jgi:hypothetical protein
MSARRAEDISESRRVNEKAEEESQSVAETPASKRPKTDVRVSPLSALDVAQLR